MYQQISNITVEYRSLFIGFIKKWYAEFRDLLSNFLNQGSKIFLVAISRKMPRFFDWMIRNNDRLGLEGLEELIANTEYITEYALPFVFKSISPEEHYNVVVVDDCMVTGNTVRNVTQDVLIYTGGKKPVVSVIVSGMNPQTSLVDADSWCLPTCANDKTVAQWLEFVSECNAESQLPIDIVFPIFHLDGNYNESYVERFSKSFNSDKWYYIDKQGIQKSINALLDEDMAELTALDFAKVRIFFDKDSAKIAVFSPFVVSYADLRKDSQFVDENLNQAWTKVKITPSLPNEKRTLLSLVAVLNYLYAVNTLQRNRSLLVPDNASISLRIKDLSLILGSSLAEEIFEDLSVAINVEENGRSYLIHRLELPAMSVPDELMDAYMMQRKLIASRHIGDDKKEDVIRELFDQASFDKDILGQNISLFHRMYSSFFESFDSMQNLLRQYFEKEGLRLLVNKTVDLLIDTGRIIPRYVEVSGGDGLTYWRRYFTSAYSSVEL